MSTAKQRGHKPCKIGQKYRESYSVTWPFITASTTGPFFVYCKVCRADVSVKHSGTYDIKQYIKTAKHQASVSVRAENQSVLKFMNNRQSEKNSMKVINAECLMTNFIVEHNLPIVMTDHLTKLLPQMFPDSQIAQEYACKRTKTTHIIHHMASHHQKNIVDLMISGPFAIMTDGSSDRGVEAQLYPLVVRCYSKTAGRILRQLLAMPECQSACTGENIFQLMDTTLKSKAIAWDRCIAYGSDNASVMMGAKKGVAAFVTKENPAIFISGCTCHLLNLAVSKAADAIPVNIGDLLVDIFYYLDKSSKRKQLLKEIQQVYSAQSHAILKHCATRWLSLQNCISRLLEQMDSLTVFFRQESQANRDKENKNPPASCMPPPQKKMNFSTSAQPPSNEKADPKKPENSKVRVQSKASQVYYRLIDPRTKLFCLFFEAQLPEFTQMNLLLQSDEPVIHKVRSKCIDLVTNLLLKFVKPEVISKATDVASIPHRNRESLKDREHIVIGSAAREFLQECKRNGSMSSDDRTEFYTPVRLFFSNALDYIFKKFPLQDDALMHAEVVDIEKRKVVKFASVQYFISRFPCIVPATCTGNSSQITDRLQMEFLR